MYSSSLRRYAAAWSVVAFTSRSYSRTALQRARLLIPDAESTPSSHNASQHPEAPNDGYYSPKADDKPGWTDKSQFRTILEEKKQDGSTSGPDQPSVAPSIKPDSIKHNKKIETIRKILVRELEHYEAESNKTDDALSHALRSSRTELLGEGGLPKHILTGENMLDKLRAEIRELLAGSTEMAHRVKELSRRKQILHIVMISMKTWQDSLGAESRTLEIVPESESGLDSGSSSGSDSVSGPMSNRSETRETSRAVAHRHEDGLETSHDPDVALGKWGVLADGTLVVVYRGPDGFLIQPERLFPSIEKFWQQLKSEEQWKSVFSSGQSHDRLPAIGIRIYRTHSTGQCTGKIYVQSDTKRTFLNSVGAEITGQKPEIRLRFNLREGNSLENGDAIERSSAQRLRRRSERASQRGNAQLGKVICNGDYLGQYIDGKFSPETFEHVRLRELRDTPTSTSVDSTAHPGIAKKVDSTHNPDASAKPDKERHSDVPTTTTTTSSSSSHAQTSDGNDGGAGAELPKTSENMQTELAKKAAKESIEELTTTTETTGPSQTPGHDAGEVETGYLRMSISNRATLARIGPRPAAREDASSSSSSSTRVTYTPPPGSSHRNRKGKRERKRERELERTATTTGKDDSSSGDGHAEPLPIRRFEIKGDDLTISPW